MATFDRLVSRVTGPLARYAAGFTAGAGLSRLPCGRAARMDFNAVRL